MMPYTQISTHGDDLLPSTLCFGSGSGDPGGGNAGGGKRKPAKKGGKKAASKTKKKR